MFAVGDKIVYPMHGAGIVNSIEQRELNGGEVPYLVMGMLLSDMKVMVPVANVDRVGLRHIIAPSELTEVEERLANDTGENNRGMTWNRRLNLYLDKMKSGNVLLVAEVIHTLQTQENEKKLSTGERRLLGTARQILISEVMLVNNAGQEETEQWLDNFFV